VVTGAGLRPDAAVADAAKRGDLARVRALIAARADVDAAQGDGMTALHWAADRGDAALAKILLRARANTAVRTRVGEYTPLHIASRKGHVEVVTALLAAAAPVDAPTSSGATALHLASAAGSVPIVSALLDHQANIEAREREWGQTPLMFAASADRADVVNVLLARGAKPSVRSRTLNLADEEKRDQAATRARNEQLIAFLPEQTRDSIRAAEARAAQPARQPGAAGAAATPAGPDSSARTAAATPPANPRVGLNAPPTTSLTATQIQSAIAAGRAVLQKPPTGGPATEVADTADGQIAGYAAGVGSMGGLSALHHAARQGNLRSALALLDGGAEINLPSSSDSTPPLLIAVLNGHFDLARALVARGANVKAASVIGMTPLYATINTMWAPRSRYPQPQSVQYQKTSHIELMTALLAAGADPNVRLTRQPWYFAYNNCGNANCGLESLEGTNAFWRATYAVDVEAMRLLKAHGAEYSVPSRPPSRARGARPGAAAANAVDSAARGAAAGGAATPPANRQPVAGGNVDPAAARLTPEMDSAARAVPPGAGVFPIHAAAGVGYGNGFAGNSHRHAPEGWMPAMKFLVEELGADVNARDNNGYAPLHHAAARGDNEMILYLVSKGADVKAVARNGRTTVDMANGPVQRLRPFPETIALLEKLGAKNNHRCVGC
jgi:ankyrin repeat protein